MEVMSSIGIWRARVPAHGLGHERLPFLRLHQRMSGLQAHGIQRLDDMTVN